MIGEMAGNIVHISISIENQKMADIRLKYFLEAPIKHREVFSLM